MKMLLITEKQKEILSEFLPKQADKLLDAGDFDEITDELMFLTIEYSDEDGEPTDKSRVAERFMDDLIWQNLHPEDFPVYNGKTVRE